ncbi:MAG: SIR2 family protein [Magnetococcus sp. DMHC-8]
MPHGDDLRSQTTLMSIHNGVRNAQFTPFLGAGASALRPDPMDLTQEPWKEISERIAALHAAADGATRLYLRSFFDARFGIDKASGDALFTGTVNPAPFAGPVFDFQGKLARAITELTKVFGEEFTNTCQAVGNLNDVQVPYDITRHKPSFVSLRQAIDTARQINTRTTEPVPGELFVSGIVRKLLAMAHRLASHTTRSADVFVDLVKKYSDEIRRGLTGDATTLGDTGELRIEYLEWMSDLLWYTMRFQARHYPTTSELALELSLRDTFTPPITPDLAHVAEGLERQRGSRPGEEYLAQLLRPYIAYWEDVDKVPQRFHRVITAALYYQYECYTFRRKLDAASPPPLPILFTTNFDQAIERHFSQHRINYHVVIPSSDTGQAGRWKFLTSRGSGFSDPIPCEQAISEEGNPAIDLVGPIVVKLHGSPLTPLSQGCHSIVLSESDYLKSMLSAAPLPRFVERALMDERELWFLGYSMSDWNIKLRLYKHAFGPASHSTGAGVASGFPRSRHTHSSTPAEAPACIVDPVPIRYSKHSLVKRVSPYRVAIFQKLNIGLYDGDIHSLSPIIQDALEQIADAIERDAEGNLLSGASPQYRGQVAKTIKSLLG